MKGLLWVRGGKEMVKISGCNRIVKIGKQKSEKNPAGDWKSLENPEKTQGDKTVEKLGIRKEKQENGTGKPACRKRNDTAL